MLQISGFMVSQRGIEVSPDQVKASWKHLPLVALGRFIALFIDELQPFSLEIRRLEHTMDGQHKTLLRKLNTVSCSHPS
ncbi:hypothetical protein AAG906_004986 [Vitis piasezkii]